MAGYSLTDPVTVLPGVGPKRAEALAKLGITRLGDFADHFPRTYQDRTRFADIGYAEPGQTVCVRAVVGTAPTTANIRRGLSMTKCKVFDETGSLGLVFFNSPYVKNQLTLGAEYVFYGRIELRGRTRSMTNPEFEALDKGAVTGRILPVYPMTEGITKGVMLQGVRAALSCPREQFRSILPPELVPGGMAIYDAYQQVHFPADQQHMLAARDRLIFEELFLFSLASLSLKTRGKQLAGSPMVWHDPEEFYAALPFAPTGAQKRAVGEAFRDLCSGSRMNRLVQGDVGSGKTLVAAACAWLCAKNGLQTVVMAPTELLARQHQKTFAKLLQPFGLEAGLLVSALPAAVKRTVKAQAADGTLPLVCGTHALLQGDAAFPHAGLFIVDEQHRFGVEQRAALAAKAPGAHTLVMSATPIPRTLTLIIFGDLDVSVIDELPPGRQPVETLLIGEDKRQRMEGFIRKNIAEGGQAYIVCPLIEDETGESEKQAAAELWDRLRKKTFPDLQVGLLHGKMKPAEKEAVMTAFAENKYQVLVSTTVVEVGVDVPNANLMVVENAEQFGLSQLHQLRGRVGRGDRKSYCILVSEGRDIPRLKALCATSDGFKIAEEDLKLRGPGDFFGSRQHGLPAFRLADLATDMRVLQAAQKAAADLLNADPRLDRHPDLKMRVERIFARTQEGGLN